MSILIGALIGLGSLASHSELTVLRAAGMTSWQIAGVAVKASLVMVFITLLIAEMVAPKANKSAEQLRSVALSGGELNFSQSGLWAKKGNKIVRLGEILSTGQFADVMIFQLNESNRLESYTQAKEAHKQESSWLLKQVKITHFESNAIRHEQISELVWEQPLMDSHIETLSLEPDSLNIAGLYDYLDYLKENRLEYSQYQLVFWQKIFLPLSIVVMMFLATAFVMGPMRDVSVAARILSGVFLGFGFHLANQSFGPISLVFNLWPFFGAALPVIIFAGVGYSLMRSSS